MADYKFHCEQCGILIIKTERGTIKGCSHHPRTHISWKTIKISNGAASYKEVSEQEKERGERMRKIEKIQERRDLEASLKDGWDL